MIKLIICGLAFLMAAFTSHKTEWMAFFIWFRHFLGIELDIE